MKHSLCLKRFVSWLCASCRIVNSPSDRFEKHHPPVKCEKCAAAAATAATAARNCAEKKLEVQGIAEVLNQTRVSVAVQTKPLNENSDGFIIIKRTLPVIDNGKLRRV